MPLDRLTPPFAIHDKGSCFMVVDAIGAVVAVVHYDEREIIGTGFTERLSKVCAHRVATQIRRLPDLVGR